MTTKQQLIYRREQSDNSLRFFYRMTREHRENLSKLAKATSEQSKQVLRKVRQKGIGDVRKNKQGRSEDDIKRVEKMVRDTCMCCCFLHSLTKGKMQLMKINTRTELIGDLPFTSVSK